MRAEPPGYLVTCFTHLLVKNNASSGMLLFWPWPDFRHGEIQLTVYGPMFEIWGIGGL